MPPKGWRKTASGFQPTNSSGVAISDRKVHGIEELLLPRSLVAKIAKQSLPEHMPLPKDGVTALMRSTTMFISYITAEANRVARSENRKTITPADVSRALEAAYFGSFVNPVAELSAEIQASRKSGDSEAGVSADPDEVRDEDDYIEEDVEPDQTEAAAAAARAEKKQKVKESEAPEEEMQVDS